MLMFDSKDMCHVVRRAFMSSLILVFIRQRGQRRGGVDDEVSIEVVYNRGPSGTNLLRSLD